ncbi:hypothetical protein HBI73_214680 [Parastagonospora nodorum]|nr:hypothetical protein HBH82_230270 [Parastagonospora nodorum]KAH4661418.1 hypothetical protein HBH78_222300 [Parastagonospora nodorum]KAH4691505.1 hypothetical protein HBH67_243210 [Parastagonospora nodorum]KAH4755754.1 hypothetical protein HBH63_231200 [Parastagonospora nodorum]KAH4769803.1 hypothetical protein HBH62_227740 [Parastagonospora nodorum]
MTSIANILHHANIAWRNRWDLYLRALHAHLRFNQLSNLPLSDFQTPRLLNNPKLPAYQTFQITMHHITMDQIIMYLVDALDQLKAYATTASSTLGWIVFILGFWAWSTSPRLFWNTMRFLCDTLTIMLRRAFIGM